MDLCQGTYFFAAEVSERYKTTNYSLNEFLESTIEDWQAPGGSGFIAAAKLWQATLQSRSCQGSFKKLGHAWIFKCWSFTGFSMIQLTIIHHHSSIIIEESIVILQLCVVSPKHLLAMVMSLLVKIRNLKCLVGFPPKANKKRHKKTILLGIFWGCGVPFFWPISVSQNTCAADNRGMEVR